MPEPAPMTMLKLILPIAILLAGSLGAWAIVASAPELETSAPTPQIPVAYVVHAHRQTMRLNVRSQGIVTPRTEIDLVPEVAGKIVQLHPSLVAGGFFKTGDLLLSIDPRDYEYAIAEAAGRIAEAKRQLALEEAQAEQARSEWQALGEGQAPTPLTLREPHVAEARAKLKAAEADMTKARLNYSRCQVHAPFAGRVKEQRVGVGQYVQPGEKLARLYATDVAEVRLPIAADQLAHLDLPLGHPPPKPDSGPRVTLSAELAGVINRWEGRIVRTEGTMDETTGAVNAVAEVRDPYAARHNRAPLLLGLFVTAEIEGKPQSDLFALPQAAVNAAQEALLVDQQNRLHVRRLQVVRSEAERVLVLGSLSEGDRLVVGGIRVPIEGMKVEPMDYASAQGLHPEPADAIGPDSPPAVPGS